MVVNNEDALYIAKKFGLEYEVEQSIREGMSPENALAEWDIPMDYKLLKFCEDLIYGCSELKSLTEDKLQSLVINVYIAKYDNF